MDSLDAHLMQIAAVRHVQLLKFMQDLGDFMPYPPFLPSWIDLASVLDEVLEAWYTD